MKTIIENTTNLSKYLFDDTEVIRVSEVNIVIGDPVQFSIADLNANTTTVYENLTAPVDWIGNKYTFDGTDWTLNPDWVEPTPPEELTVE